MARRQLDSTELEYERAIAAAAGRGDNDTAQDLVTGLREYRELYKIPADPEEN